MLLGPDFALLKGEPEPLQANLPLQVFGCLWIQTGAWDAEFARAFALRVPSLLRRSPWSIQGDVQAVGFVLINAPWARLVFLKLIIDCRSLPRADKAHYIKSCRWHDFIMDKNKQGETQ